jgi:two-component system sensor kinase FixL
MKQVETLNVAIVGGGPGCKALMDMIFAEKLRELRMKVIGVASTKPEAVGYLYAKEKGVYTTKDYRDLYSLKDLNMIIELTGHDEVANEILATKPDNIRLMDHVGARLFWDVFQIEEKRNAERELADEALRKSEQEKQGILNSISEAVVYLDKEHRIIWANRVAREWHGFTPEEVEKHRCYKLWHQLSKPCPGCPVTKTFQTGEPQEAEMTSIDGRVWFVRGYPVRDENDNIVGAVELTLEITERKQAERALKESEEKHRTVLEASPDPIVIYDMEGKCTYANPAFTAVFGWTQEERLGKKLDYVPDENWPETQAMIDKVKAGKSFSDVESRRHTKSGDIVDVSVSAGIYVDRNGTPVGSVHVLRDISARKRAQEALRESEQRYRTVLEASPDPVVIYDMEGTCIYTNPAFTAVFGWTQEERLGKKLDYVPDENWPETKMMIDKLKVGESFSGVQSRRYTKSGDVVDVSVSAGIHLDPDGTPVGSVHVLRDITAQTRAQEETKRAYAELNQIFNTAVDGMRVIDKDFNLIRTSETFLTLSGLSETQCKGKKCYEIFPGSLCHTPECPLTIIVGGEERVECEVEKEHADGTKIPCIVTATPFRGSDGKLIGIVEDTRNISERKAAERKIEQTMTELQRSNAELQQFAYVASHDLQEPLRKIQAFGDRLRARYTKALDERGGDYLNRMQNAAKRMQALINNLLTLSRITTQAQPFIPVNLANVAQKVLSDLELHIERAGGIVKVGDLSTVDADPTQMRQLLQNLINNALKFHHPEKKPVIKVYGQSIDKICELIVEDNGIGFDEKYLDRIFGVFQRLHGRGEYDGTGVGLAICQKIAERHGGGITAKSTPGQGATFVVTLPVEHIKEKE